MGPWTGSWYSSLDSNCPSHRRVPLKRKERLHLADLGSREPWRLTETQQASLGRDYKWSQPPMCLVLDPKDCPVWTQVSIVEKNWDLNVNFLITQEWKRGRKKSSLLKAFYNSARLRPWFGELDPVTANWCGRDTWDYYWRSSDGCSNPRGHWILTCKEANLGEGGEARSSAVLGEQIRTSQLELEKRVQICWGLCLL